MFVFGKISLGGGGMCFRAISVCGYGYQWPDKLEYPSFKQHVIPFAVLVEFGLICEELGPLQCCSCSWLWCEIISIYDSVYYYTRRFILLERRPITTSILSLHIKLCENIVTGGAAVYDAFSTLLVRQTCNVFPILPRNINSEVASSTKTPWPTRIISLVNRHPCDLCVLAAQVMTR